MKTSSTDNLKLRHLTGAYLHMPDAPTEEDLLYFLSTQKHKATVKDVIIKAFGDQKVDKIESCIRNLQVMMKVSISEGGVVSIT